jgi:hypothetical protein
MKVIAGYNVSLVRRKTCFKCPSCAAKGGTIVNKAVKSSVQVPRFLTLKEVAHTHTHAPYYFILPSSLAIGSSYGTSWKFNPCNIVYHIETIPQAFDYAAKVCTRIHDIIKKDPFSDSLDIRYSSLFHRIFEKFSPHSTEMIRQFELKYLTGKGENRSVAIFKYGAILFTALFKIWNENITRSLSLFFPAILVPKERSLYTTSITGEQRYVFALCSFFQYLNKMNYYDKNTIHPNQWLDVLNYANKHGYNAAASKFQVNSYLCKKCSNARKEDFISMAKKVYPNRGAIFYCPKCGGFKSLKRKYSVNTIKEHWFKPMMEYGIILFNCKPYLKYFSRAVESVLLYNEEFSTLVQEEFTRLERNEANKLSFQKCRSSYIKHYTPGGDRESKWCHLRSDSILKVDVDDEIYKNFVAKIASAARIITFYSIDGTYKEYWCEDKGFDEEMMKNCRERLMELRYPNEFILRKIKQDIQSFLKIDKAAASEEINTDNKKGMEYIITLR